MVTTLTMISSINNHTTVMFHEVEDINEAQTMRRIRNECREYMTKNSDLISKEDQVIWFNGLDRDNIKMYIMFESYFGVVFSPIGFGYCRHVDDETYLTGGLIADSRGKGYGRILFQHLLDKAKTFNTKITLEVLQTNAVAQKLYTSIGFVPYYSDDRIIKMEFKNDPAV